MELITAARPRLSDVLYQELSAWIYAGRAAPDGRLPSEKELSDRFKVSRPVVREALRRLREEGLIESRQGAGSFVTPKASNRGDQFPQIRTIADVRHVYQFRIALEGEIAAVAAINRQDLDLERLEAQLLRMDDGNEMAALEADLDFHATLAQATQNAMFVSAFSTIRAQIMYVIDLGRNNTNLSSLGQCGAAQTEHAAIIEAIREGNAQRARDAMRTHIRNARNRLFDGIPL
ncbi:FadR family transcriptional regulator [Ensifer sp. ENS05]|uniref:FadR/GntR family transcriptional regulator n=1 Tax=Ensifer sp. ENS05 TaxID=2769277 RepID=UPI00177FB96C|nr:FadR/GntR family transcriptional regulator [Ensifer sp. ENS05]MBD9596919.1 FadR family transcriptional regulator [Ensifer sp. ENS05]